MGWAGNKDKTAVTTQLISLQNLKQEEVEVVSIKDISLEYFGRGNERVFVGNLQGNKFEIVIRNLEENDCERITSNFENIKKKVKTIMLKYLK